MKKFLLAPAVAVVAGSMTLAGNVAFAATAPAPEAPKAEQDAPKSAEDNKSQEKTAKYALKVSPKEVTPGDFVKKDKGVKLVVTGLKPNEKFTYSVSKQAGNGKVETLFNDVQANKDGVWAYTVYGQKGDADLQGFVGTYKVTVKSEAGALTDTFKVTNTSGKKDDPKPEKPKPEAPKPCLLYTSDAADE